MAQGYEEDELDRLKGWWQDYGNYLLAGLLFGLVAVLGWRFYQNRQATQAVKAAEYYEQFSVALERDDAQSILALEQTLRERFAGVPYTVLAELALARRAVDKDDLKGAQQALERARDAAGDDPLGSIARLRLARVHLAQAAPEAALDALEPLKDQKALRPLVEELRGDALRALGRTNDARSAYRAARDAATAAALDERLIDLKLKDMGEEAP
ncbi:MAG: YfgM family protein [Pseudomonadota bacterium]